jgi:threonine dehydrogenase-like Zn-dependent dehydrogenase
MHALTFAGKERIDYSEVKDPELLNSSDVIVKITKSGICGSDLHVYHARETGIDHGTVMGHEFVGIIEEQGRDVRKFKKGDKVLSPFTTSCGECYYCRIGLTCRCEKGKLYGWVENGQGLEGAQAEYIRVPMADSTLLPLSSDLDENKGLLLGDVFSTGFYCADNLRIKTNHVSVVIGCGPVGLMAILAARYLGGEKIIAVDKVPERLSMAEKFGAIPVDVSKVDVKQFVLSKTNGRGADGVMEVVGSNASLQLAIDILRPGGIISSVGVHTEKHFPFSPGMAYDKNLIYKAGRCPAYYYAEKLLREEVPQQLPIEEIITHQFKISEGPGAYEIFDQKKDGCIKSMLVLD